MPLRTKRVLLLHVYLRIERVLLLCHIENQNENIKNVIAMLLKTRRALLLCHCEQNRPCNATEQQTGVLLCHYKQKDIIASQVIKNQKGIIAMHLNNRRMLLPAIDNWSGMIATSSKTKGSYCFEVENLNSIEAHLVLRPFWFSTEIPKIKIHHYYAALNWAEFSSCLLINGTLPLFICTLTDRFNIFIRSTCMYNIMVEWTG